MIKIFKGYCPTIDEEHQITVTYSPIRMAGNPNLAYKITEFECSLAAFNRCSLSNPDDCPIFKQAKG